MRFAPFVMAFVEVSLIELKVYFAILKSGC